MEKLIPLSVPNLRGNEIEYVTDAVGEEWVSTNGAYVTRFEDDMAEYLGIDGGLSKRYSRAAYGSFGMRRRSGRYCYRTDIDFYCSS